MTPKRRRTNPGEKRNYHHRANRFTTQTPATATFTVTEAARAKKPTEENIEDIVRATGASSTVPPLNIHDGPPECLDEGEGRVVEVIKTALEQQVSEELHTDHFIGRCVRKGKEANPAVSVEEYVTSLCERAEDMKVERQKYVASRYVGVEF